MEIFNMAKPSATPRVESEHPLRDLVATWYTPRRGLVLAGLGIIVAGLALGWNWLTAIGVAPLILSLAPCAAMCALGLCMVAGANSRGKKKDSDEKMPPSAPGD